ncbi:putative cop9 signalosome subunit 7 [Phaeomoniella chlamydospora]|uniref:Putative cop9 signalosome subunit 7 n=1 Tax=Phaeomoniella chlamydospora TaxID=158046 RepID=A0A0G2GGQ6_PHACM|nr:putative cop9 signalosome subunit 7 [Phaeomoniella chlamydospora]
MDPSQTKALTALEPFIQTVLTSKSPTPRFLADIITRATSAQGTYIFTELLQLEQIQSLQSSPEFKNYLTLLELFSWGTWEDFQATTGLPSLNEAQTLKLRQLSILSLAASPSFALTYANLLQSLSLSTPSELESLITATIYSELITARLSPITNPPVVHITSTAPLRDLRPLSLGHLIKVLETWEGRCAYVVNDLESQIEGIKASARKRAAKEATRDALLENALKEIKSEAKDTTTGQGAGARVAGPGHRKGHAGFPVRTVGGGRKNKGANKRDLEETEDDGEETFEDAPESGLTDDGMDVDEGVPIPQSSTAGGRLAKRRGG